VVEVGGDEVALERRREAPRPVVEALTGDRQVVCVEHAMAEAGGHPPGAYPRARGAGPIEEREDAVLSARGRQRRENVVDAAVDEPPHRVRLALAGEPLRNRSTCFGKRAGATMSRASAPSVRTFGSGE